MSHNTNSKKHNDISSTTQTYPQRNRQSRKMSSGDPCHFVVITKKNIV